jgi:hypothetical protein
VLSARHDGADTGEMTGAREIGSSMPVFLPQGKLIVYLIIIDKHNRAPHKQAAG